MPYSIRTLRAALPLAAALFLATPAARAAEGPLTLPEVLRLATGQSRQLAAQDAAVAAAREMAVAAGQLPDPVLRLGIDNLPVNGSDAFSLTRDFMTMRRVGVMQEFTREEKRKLRTERGEQEAERESAARRATLAGLQRDAATAWLDRYYAERMLAVSDSLVAQNQALMAAAEAAYRGGRGTQSDVLAASAALVMLEDRRDVLARQARMAQIALARWIGPAAERGLGGAPDIRALPFDSAKLDSELQHHPQLGTYSRQITLAETNARLAEAGKKADWSVELAYQQRGPSYSNMVSVGVSIPLQIDSTNRQDRELASKRALVEQSRAQFEDALRAHTAEVRAMMAEWQSGLARLDRLEKSLMPIAVQRSAAALSAYRGNAGTLTAVLDALRNEREVSLQTIQLTADTARVWAQLNYLFPEDDHAMTVGAAGRSPQ